MINVGKELTKEWNRSSHRQGFKDWNPFETVQVDPRSKTQTYSDAQRKRRQAERKFAWCIICGERFTTCVGRVYCSIKCERRGILVYRKVCPCGIVFRCNHLKTIFHSYDCWRHNAHLHPGGLRTHWGTRNRKIDAPTGGRSLPSGGETAAALVPTDQER